MTDLLTTIMLCAGLAVPIIITYEYRRALGCRLLSWPFQ
jgi:hypothetical protein